METVQPVQSAAAVSFVQAGTGPPARKDLCGAIRRVAVGCSIAVIALGVFVLAGWAVGSEAMTALVSGHVSMKVNTALGFVAAGSGLLCFLMRVPQCKVWAILGAVMALAIGGGTLAEYVYGVDLKIDQVLVVDRWQQVNPGRPAEVTAIAFCLSGVALWVLTGGRGLRRGAQMVATGLTSLAFASIVGYLYGVPLLYGSLRNVNSMALHTGVGFLILGWGILLASPDSSIVLLLASCERGGWLLRRFLPLIAVAPVALGYLYQHRSVNFGEMRFGMALFAVTMALGGGIGSIFLGFFLNRSEEKQRELTQTALEAAAAIELSERELRLVTDHLPILLSYLSADGRYLRVNRTYEEWFGVPASEIVGRRIQDLLGKAYWERTRSARAAAEIGGHGHVETLYPTVRGERWSMVTYTADRDGEGALRGYACMIVDVDEQRRAEAALRESERLAALGRLSSSIAHEINNPIDAAMNLIFLAREDTTDQGMRNLLDTADSELKRVAAIAGQTLGYHKMKAYAELVTGERLFRSVLTLHEGRLRKHGIRLEQRDRATEPVLCIEGEIRQVLNNLISNAVDAMKMGGRLMLRSRAGREWSSGRRGVTLTIADDGTGMDARTQARVFEAFFTTKGVEGTGLGLWISAEILARHGSQMRIRSRAGEASHGTVFTIFLPYEGSGGARVAESLLAGQGVGQ